MENKEPLEDWRRNDLAKECNALGLSDYGVRAVLIDRIKKEKEKGDQQKTRPIAGWGDQRGDLAMKGDQIKTHPVASWGDQGTNYVAGSKDEKKTECNLYGEILPVGINFLKIHEEHYHFQEVIELD